MSLTPDEFKAWRAKQAGDHRYRLKPNPGFVANPLRTYPRNDPCLCGSGKKWKKCCGPDAPMFIPKDELDDHKKVLRGESIE